MPYKNKDVQNAYQVKRMKARREAWLAANGPCVECGSWDNLEVDHVDPTKKVTHRVWSWAPLKMEVELAKCQVLCHDCHSKKTLAQTRIQVRHGTFTMYRKGCKCEQCMEAMRNQKRYYRAKVKREITSSSV